MIEPSIRLPESALESSPAREAIRIIQKLRDAGFTAVLAGGCVRDALLGRTPKDFDVATDATPDSVREVFGKRNTLAFGASFGVIGVLPEREKHQSKPTSIQPTEVATFRADGNYSDGRRPDSVTFGDAQADALRRDFTINGMFYDPLAEQVLDYVGGLQDLKKLHLRTIGDPARRFDEDKLRMLRAIRFVTTLNLTMEPATLTAIQTHAESIDVVSGERIGSEMQRVMNQPSGHEGLNWLVETRLNKIVWPHYHSVDTQLMKSRYGRIRSWSFEVAMAITLLTLHPSPVDAKVDLHERAAQWKLSAAQLRAIEVAILTANDLVHCHAMAWSKLQPMLIDRDIATTMATAEAIVDPEHTGGVEHARNELQRTDRLLDPPPLLTGNDLIENGIKPGPQFRLWLNHIRRAQLDGEMTTFDDAFQWIQNQ